MFDSINPELLKIRPKLNRKIYIVGIGNIMKGDDGAGPEIIKRLSEKKSLPDRYKLLDVGETPENYLRKIINEKPDTVLLVDIADMKVSPGTIKILNYDDIIDNSLSTHNASLKLTMDFIKSEINTDIFLIGIQPAELGFGKPISPAVSKAIDEITKLF